MIVTTTEFVTAVENRFSTPADQDRFDEDAILLLGDEETQVAILPLILALHKDYLVRETSVAVTASTTSYRVPARAVGRKIRAIKYLVGSCEYSMREINIGEAWRFANSASSQPSCYYWLGDKFVPVPTPTNTAATFTVAYETRVSELVPTDEACQITAINAGTGALTCTTVDTAIFSTSTPVDLIRNTPGNDILSLDLTPSNVSSTIVTVAAASLPAELAVGDWISLAGTTPVLQVMEELRPLLVLATARRMLTGLGDIDMLKVADAQWIEAKKDLVSLFTQRNSTSRAVILNRSGFLRRPSSNNRFYRGL